MPFDDHTVHITAMEPHPDPCDPLAPLFASGSRGMVRPVPALYCMSYLLQELSRVVLRNRNLSNADSGCSNSVPVIYPPGHVRRGYAVSLSTRS